jgi:uncharacterized protein YbjT (DUF2867 family)
MTALSPKPVRVLVTGGTGGLAREICVVAADRNVTLRLTSRRPFDPSHATPSALAWIGADLATGRGLAEALRDVDTVIHTASDFTRPDLVDVEGTRRLVMAAREAGVRHLLYVSIVGIDRIPYPYYRAKLAAEQIVVASDVPYSILRATQFHTLIDARLRAAARFPLVMPLPRRFQFQTVDTREVAERLLDVAVNEPQQRLPDFGGPEVLRLGDMANDWRRATGIAKHVLPLPLAGKVASSFRAGRNTAPSGVLGTLTWREWLARRYPRRQP